jgi:hypothetical protein
MKILQNGNQQYRQMQINNQQDPREAVFLADCSVACG